LFRRYDPNSSRTINLNEIPSDFKEDLSKWIHAPNDWDNVLEERFKESENAENRLKKAFKVKNDSNPVGIFHSLPVEGLSVDTVFELVEAHLIRPVPST
jgi:hypothetical protein